MTARSPRLAWARLMVAAGWFTVALCVLMQMQEAMTFTWHSGSGIQGWIAVHRHPQRQEGFFFLAAVCGIPAIMAVGWLGWAIIGNALARWRRRPPATGLGEAAILHLFLLAPWPALLALDHAAWRTWLRPASWLGWGMPLAIALAVMHFWRRRHGHSGPEQEPRAAPPSRWSASPPPAACSESKDEEVVPATKFVRLWRISWRIGYGMIAFALMPAFIYWFGYQSQIDGGTDLFHESELLVPMSEIMHGAIPFRDIYLQHGLFHNAWFPRMGAALFGPTLAGVRSMTNGLAPLTFVAAYFLVLTSFRFGLVSAVAATGIFFASGIGGRGMLGFLAIAAMAAAITPPAGFKLWHPGHHHHDDVAAADHFPGWRACVRLGWRHGWPLALSGFLAMMAVWHSVEVGLYALASCGALVVVATMSSARTVKAWRRPWPLACLVAGMLTGFGIIGWYFVLHGALADLARNWWIQCFHQRDTWGLAMPGFLAVLRPLLCGPARPELSSWLKSGPLQFHLGAMALTMASATLVTRAGQSGFWRSRWAPQLLLLTFSGACFYRTVLGRSDSAHTHYSVFFATLLGLFAVAALAGKAKDALVARESSRGWRMAAGIWFGLGACLVAGAMAWYVQIRWQPGTVLARRWQARRNPPSRAVVASDPLPRAGHLHLGGNQAAAMMPVIDYIRRNTNPDERVFDFSNQALWLFFADRRPPSRYFLVAYASRPDMQREVIADIERHAVQLVIYRGGTWFDHIDGIAQEQRHPLIAEYLQENFVPADNIGRVQFWRRKSSPGG